MRYLLVMIISLCFILKLSAENSQKNTMTARNVTISQSEKPTAYWQKWQMEW